MEKVENELAKKLEEALSEMCEDAICEVAAVEAVCEDILADLEEESNSLGLYRKRRSSNELLDIYWPQRHFEKEAWKYWRRNETSPIITTFRNKRNIDREINAFKRHKRQFGFSLDHLFGNVDTVDMPVQNNPEVQENYLGVLINIITRSLASDIGISRFGSFLSDLQAHDGKLTSEDFFMAFAREFGEDKAALLRELVFKKISGMILPGSHKSSQEEIHDTKRFPPAFPGSSSSPNYSDLMNHDQIDLGESLLPSDQDPSRKALKVHFTIEGHGADATSRLQDAVDHILSAVNTGVFDVSYGEQQLQVAAVRLNEDPEYICEPGSVLRGDLCINCPIGTFFNVVLKDCQPCPQGSFQGQEGQVSCLVCPENTSTKRGNAKSGEECKARCLPGSYSNDGLEPCTTCEIGQYQDEYASYDCMSCPHNTTTWRRGSWVIDECKYSYAPEGMKKCRKVSLVKGLLNDEDDIEADIVALGNEWRMPLLDDENNREITKEEVYLAMRAIKAATCQEGEVSENGLQPCLQCPQGFFQEEIGQTLCFKCPEGVSTAGSGSSSIFDCEGISREEQDAVYTNLPTLPINDCFSEPCHNGGSCTVMDFGHLCQCRPGYAGQQCELELNECESEPCLNGGSCIDLLDAFFCDCSSGFTGSQCEIDINECDPDPCQNGATCVNLIDAFKCICQSGYT
ncbi:hypothetical protein SK128_010136, partial [Halocaridina rubra]